MHSPPSRQFHNVDHDAVDVQPVVAPEEAQRPGLQHVHVVGPTQLDPANFAHFPVGATRMGYHHSRGRAVLQLHVTALITE